MLFDDILVGIIGRSGSAGSPEAGVRSWLARATRWLLSGEGDLALSCLPTGLPPLSWFSSPRQKTIPSLYGLIFCRFGELPGRSAGCQGKTKGSCGDVGLAATASWWVPQLLPETSHRLQTAENRQLAYGDCHRSVRFLLEINEF